MPIKLFLFTFFIAFFLGSIIISILKSFALKRKVLTSKEMPLVGGIGLALSFILSSLIVFSIYGIANLNIKGVIFASLLMLIFGIIDDWRELSIISKFLVQIIATSLLIAFGVRTQIIHLGNFFNILITFIWVLGITNAFNHLDIMDGLCAGVGLIVSLSFFIVALLNADVNVAILSLILAAAIISFLFYNFPPAKVYLGNAGSHFLGFTLAAIAMIISYAPLERKVALVSPLLILGLPIYDTTFLILMRWKSKRSILKKSKDHLTLRFLNLGYSHRRTLIYMYMLGILFSLVGILVSQLPNQLGIRLIALVVIIALALTKRMSRVSNV